MKRYPFVALLLCLCTISGLHGQDSNDYLQYAIPSDAKKLGPGNTRDGKQTFNYVPANTEASWENIIARETYDGEHLTERVLLKKGVKHGVQRTWHPNGRPATEAPYKNGVMHGVFREWNEVGNLIGQYEIRDGTGVKRIYNAEGRLVREERIENSIGNGLQMNVSSIDGTLSLYWLKDGSVVGNAFAFYPMNQLESVACLSKDGVPHGPRIEFSTEGAVTRTKWFVNRKEVTRSEYATAVVSDPSLPAYYADATKYKEFVDTEVKALLEKYRKLPSVKIPLEFDQAGNPVLAR